MCVMLAGCVKHALPAGNADYVFDERKNMGESDSIVLSDIVESTQLVLLETNKNCLISHLSGAWLMNDKILIADNRSENIFLFDSLGSYVTTIGKYGSGPGEYSTLWYVDFDAESERIFILDALQQKIISFLSSGQFIGEVKFKIGCQVKSFCYAGDDQFFIQPSPQPGQNISPLLLIDKNGGIVRSFFEENAIYTSSSFRNGSFKRYKNTIRFFPSYFSKIYSFDGNDLSEWIEIVPEFSVDLDLLERLQAKQGRGELDDQGLPFSASNEYTGMWGIQNYLETDRMINFFYKSSNKLLFVFVDKFTGQVKKAKIVDDLFAGQTTINVCDSGPEYLLYELKFPDI